MSLGDALRLLRAQKGGVAPLEIEAALPDLPKGLYRQIEQRYRAMGDEQSVLLLATYYDVPFEELYAQLPWSRKALSRALVAVQSKKQMMTLTLATGHIESGEVAWWDMGAIGLRTAEGELVVQRHAVRQWDPCSPEAHEDTEQPNS